jgi:hypothetical protein
VALELSGDRWGSRCLRVVWVSGRGWGVCLGLFGARHLSSLDVPGTWRQAFFLVIVWIDIG